MNTADTSMVECNHLGRGGLSHYNTETGEKHWPAKDAAAE